MAYTRNYWRRSYRRYYRGRNASVRKTRSTRNFKASAANMTQGGTFNVSAHKEQLVTIAANKNEGFDFLDLPSLISGSEMHRHLSNVFDQYRVEKLSIKIRCLGDNSTSGNYPSILFSCMDRTGFASNADSTAFRTYGSYKETLLSGNKDISPVHWINIGQSNLVEFTSYSDTKKRPSFPVVVCGCKYAGNFSSAIQVALSVEVDAQIRYRGVRLDTSSVITSDSNAITRLGYGVTDGITDVPIRSQMFYPTLQKAIGSSETIPVGSFGISLVPGTIDGKRAIIAYVLNNATSGTQTLPTFAGYPYYIAAKPAGKYVHMIVDNDIYPVVISDHFDVDAYPGRAVFYDTILELE